MLDTVKLVLDDYFMTAKKNAHHHGDLRASLIRAGMELIGEGGAEALTIRGAAMKAGVSHAAPKHHFPTLVHLRTAIAAQAHLDFAAFMDAAIAQSSGGPRDAIIAACVGYLRFARANPGLFHVMFGVAGVDQMDPAFRAAAAKSYGILSRVCAPVSHGPEGAKGTEILVWSLAHGFSSLVLLGELGTDDPTQLEAWLERIFPDLPMA